jgi:hypothetical protein
VRRAGSAHRASPRERMEDRCPCDRGMSAAR